MKKNTYYKKTLDTYKTQAQYARTFASPPLQCSVDRDDAQVFVRIAVSYTHLDVYKRQF